ncbi:primosomal protein N' [Parachlamydia sp. AcF125]|uniref:primosomal protein N' n=1 Tax=Parachlamydia sp. AcF125 TaxID=2795736 RepID=UPI001BD8683D|nr:primosomal protein N' [Parachlamydia sp. AcF125]MBS4169106.1 Primosomal protein N' [Parachlamydia sp. AcF125]
MVLVEPQKFTKYAAVVLDVALEKALDYGIPDDLLVHAQKGVRVEVPLRGSLRNGYILAIKDTSDYGKVAPIQRIFSDVQIPEDLFELALWISRYYLAPLFQVFKILVPSSIRKEMAHKQQLFVMRKQTRERLKEECEKIRNKHPAQAAVLDVMLLVKKGILLSELLEKTGGSRSPVDTLSAKGYLLVEPIRIDRSPLVGEEYLLTKPKILSEEQQEAFTRIAQSLQDNIFQTHLLYGITGSGKTEVYLQAIEKALQMQKSAIMLVPEISLTAQTIERFKSRFPDKIAILHHRLSHGERFDEWHKIRRGEARIVIGARSAVFSPVQDLGLVIVDEEHEQSYKQQEEAPCYHARDVAVMRGKIAQATVILGSATPSIESYYNALKGKYGLSVLKHRAEASLLPTVTIVDMKREFEKAKGFTNFSEPLLNEIEKRLVTGEQTILFLNRRGYHTTLKCPSCHTSLKCPHCSLALTFYYSRNSLSCHLCDFALTPPPSICPSCKKDAPMKYQGVGTELIERSLHAVFPDSRIIRIDADTTRHKGSHQKLLRDFGTGKADVLIGTQMIAKGLHFSEVTLVGILNGDASLNIPDFRSSEIAFQLMTQVAGRAGRGVTQGKVIIQTHLPENSTIQLAAQQNYTAFFEEEILSRELFAFPPFSSLVKLNFSGPDEKKTEEFAQLFRHKLQINLPEIFTLSPVIPSGHAKVKDRYRFQFLIRGPSIYSANQAIKTTLQHALIPRDIKFLIDVNPLTTFF